MQAQARTYLTPEEYLEIERAAEYKSEYFEGEMFAMAGASRAHNLIVGNLVRELGLQLKGGPCEVYPSDMRVWIPAIAKYTYPDVTVVCEEPRFQDGQADSLLNPTVIFEVLSESTESYDRGKKFEHYRSIDSLRAYVLVAQDEPRVERFIRRSGGGDWLFSDTLDEESVDLPPLSCRLSLAEIYYKVPQID